MLREQKRISNEDHYNVCQYLNCMFHHINVKIMYVIYLQGCEIQYIRKSSTRFKVTHNNHKKDATRKDFIPASNHFDIRFTIFKVKQNLLQQNNSIKKYG